MTQSVLKVTAPLLAASLVLCQETNVNYENLTYVGQHGPFGTCAGDCDSDEDCMPGLVCYQRKGKNYDDDGYTLHDIPFGCGGKPWGSIDYCIKPPDPKEYVPGYLSTTKLGIQLSNGLDLKMIAQSGHPVRFANGKQSEIPFHGLPDFGACFSVPDDDKNNPGGWAYVSNSEIKDGGGGVGVITFNSGGDAIGYGMLLKGTSRNCGGGKTSWGTFISCEEAMTTHCHELDPFGGLVHKDDSRTALGGKDGGHFESFTSDERGKYHRVPSYFVTEDRRIGALRRFRPGIASQPDSIDWDNPFRKMLFGNGTIDYLVLEPSDDEGRIGTFYWTDDKEVASLSASLHYPNAEGIDAADGVIYFTARKNTDIFVLDLDNATYKRINVPEDGLDLSADQIVRLSGDDSGFIYLTNHGWEKGAAGVYARDAEGRYFTILESTVDEDGYRLDRLTTGLAFSKDGKHMYVCFQKAGVCFDVFRKDRLSFGGTPMNIKYHL